MRKESLLKMYGTVHALIIAVLLAWAGVQPASATGSGTKDDPYVLADGETYTVAAFSPFYGVFTAPTDGTFTLYGTNYSVYTDATFGTIDSSITPQHNGNYNDQGWSFDCTQGTTYYIGNNFLMNAASVRVTFGQGAPKLELQEASPEDGTVFDAGTGLLGLTFNQTVTIASATMKAGSAEEQSVTVNAHGAYVSVDVKDMLNGCYEAGTLNEGDDIKFTFTGVAPSADLEALYNETGVLELIYKAGPKPMRLTAMTNMPGGNPEVTTFKSYYMSDDASGVITLTFSDDINMSEGMKPTAYLTYGDTESEDPNEAYREELNVNSLGSSTIMLNLKGKLRRPQDMVTSGTNYGSMMLRIANVRDKAGNYAYSDGAGTLGSYTFTFTYEEVAYSADVEWSLIGGDKTTISADTKNVELYIREQNGNMTFDGAEFSYVSGGEEQTKAITMSEITVTTEDDEKTILIPVPNISADANTTVTVKLTGVERPDGLTTKVESTAMDNFTATFSTSGLVSDELMITSAVWHNGTEDVNMMDGYIGVLTYGTTSTLTTNKDSEIGYATWSLYDAADLVNGYVRSGYVSGPVAEGGFTIGWYDEALEAGKDYVFTLKAWKTEADSNNGADPNVGEATFIIHGNKAAYVYSDVTLNTDISETKALASLDDNVFDLEFSAPVTLTAVVNTGSGTSADCDVAKADDEGKVWTITMPKSTISGMDGIDVNVFAKDSEGKAVNKTANGLGSIMGSEENTWFEIHFSAEFNRPDFTIDPADGSEVESIEKITFGYAAGIDLYWGLTSEPITIYNRNTREVVATFTQDDVTVVYGDSWFDPYLTCYVTLATPITEPGTYTVEVPSGFFILGQDMTASASKATSATYVIKGGSTPSSVTIDPAAGNVTEIPATLVVTFNDYESVGNTGEPTLVDANGTSYPVHFEYGEGWNQLNVVLDNGSITAFGTYTLTIPAGAVELNDPDRHNTEDIVFVYTIGGGAGIDGLTSTEGGKVTVYDISGNLLVRDADASAVKSLAKGLYIINGKKVVIK